MAIDTSALGFTWDSAAGTVTSTKDATPAVQRERPTAPTTGRSPQEIAADAVAALRTVHDPEIPVNVYDLGLIYRVASEPAGYVEVDMTLTSPMCPAAGSLPRQVESVLRCIEGVSRVDVNLVWEPPWDSGRMSEAARLQLNLT